MAGKLWPTQTKASAARRVLRLRESFGCVGTDFAPL